MPQATAGHGIQNIHETARKKNMTHSKLLVTPLITPVMLLNKTPI